MFRIFGETGFEVLVQETAQCPVQKTIDPKFQNRKLSKDRVVSVGKVMSTASVLRDALECSYCKLLTCQKNQGGCLESVTPKVYVGANKGENPHPCQRLLFAVYL